MHSIETISDEELRIKRVEIYLERIFLTSSASSGVSTDTE